MAYKEIASRIAANPAIRESVTQSALFRPIVERFISGETREDGLSVVEALNKRGMVASLDFLGEEVHDERGAAIVRDEYLSLLDAIHTGKLRANISLKSTQLGLVFDREFCRNNLAALIERAHDYGNFVRIDMEGSRFTNDTLSLFYDLHRRYDNVGIVMQAYLYRTADDVHELVDQHARVRLCKGAYSEPPCIAYPKKKDVDENYRILMEFLLKNGNVPAIATHDENLIRHAQEFTVRHGITPENFEFQMLYGVRRDLQQEVVDDGYNLRIYVPYGKEWYPYLARRIAERPANALFVLKSIAKESFH